jgi:hypothetical protein
MQRKSLIGYQPVELGCVIVQDHVRKFQRALARDFAVIEHFGQRQSKGLASGFDCNPARLFLAVLLGIWISIGPKQNFVGSELQPLAKN